MSATLQNWLQIAGDEVPLLPDPFWLRCYMVLGWAVLMAWLSNAVVARLRPAWNAGTRQLLAAVLALWTVLPGPMSPGHWLGLAFQSPSMSSIILGVLALRSSISGRRAPAAVCTGGVSSLLWSGAGVLLGYLLLFDTLALLPWSLYPAGFSSSTMLMLLAVSVLPWVFAGRRAGCTGFWLALALLTCSLTRLPSGNVWDALIDPWLWVVLQVYLLRRVFSRSGGA